MVPVEISTFCLLLFFLLFCFFNLNILFFSALIRKWCILCGCTCSDVKCEKKPFKNVFEIFPNGKNRGLGMDVHHLGDFLREIGFFFSLLFTTNKSNRNKYCKKGLFSLPPSRPKNSLWRSWFYYLILKRARECDRITTYLYLTRIIVVYSKFEAEKLNDGETNK